MNHSEFADYHRTSKTFVACLIISLMILSPLAPLAYGAPSFSKRVEAVPTMNPDPAAPLVPSITATKTDSFPDPDSDGKAAPGQTITYDVNITNSGPDDALGVSFSDTIDANTTLVPGSLKVSPLAFADTFTGAVDTPLSVGAPGVLGNDTGLPPPTAVPIAAGATAQGGTVTLNSDGSFLYTPPSSFTGTDTFTYTATNGLTPNDTATVTISLDSAPAVTTTNPTNGATGVVTNTDITVNFSEAVNATSNSFTIECPAPGNLQAFAVSGSGTSTVTLNPNADLPAGTVCTVTVVANEITDVDSNDPPDNMTANFVFSFTTDAAPAVTTTTPTNGATGVAANSNIVVNFSEAVTVTGASFTIECPAPGNLQAFAVSGSGTSAITLNPNADLPGGTTCTVTVIANQVSDTDSADPPDNMAANFVFSFTTDAAPAVTTTTPTNGAIGVAANSDIVVNFNEAVTVTGASFTIECPAPGNLQAFAVSGSGTSAITLNPNADLPGGTTCTVTVIANQVSDTDVADPPDNMTANFVFSFSVDSAPTVTATIPTNGATQVANNTDVSITFSEAVNVTGNWFSISCATSGTHDTTNSTVSGGPTTFLINPTDFANGELCTATVFAAQVADQDANDPPENMAANFVFSFTIDLPPSVTTTVPANGAIDVLKGSNIVVNFSENVNASTSSFSIQCPAPGNLQPFAVTGSGTNQVTLNPNADLPPGVICTVTVIANQISDTDAGDPPDNMVADFVFSFGVKPEATDDARNATGNIQIQTAGRSNFSVLTNDIGPGITVTLSDTTSLRGGNVAVAANGTFSYNPPAGYEGPDSFNYTIANPAGSDVGTVNITIAGMIWFIDDNPASGACTTNNNICGRLTNPFSSLASFEAANGNATPINGADVIAPEAGDHIFIFSGNYTGPLTLEANQRVIGQGATSSLQVLSGITPATDSDALPATGGAKPSITTSGFNVVSNNQLYGLAFDDTTNTAINSNANVGTLIIGDVTILNDASNGAGIVLDDGGTSVTTTGTNTINTRSGVALSLTNATNIGAAGLTFTNISAGNNDGNTDPANGIVLNNTGATGGLTVSGGTIRFTTGSGVLLTSTRGISFSNVTIQNSGGDGITGLNVTNFTLTNSTISNNGQVVLERGIEITNLLGTASITGSTLTGNAEDNLYVQNGTGTLTLTITTTTFSNNSATVGNDGIHFLAAAVSGSNNANMSISVTNSTFTNHRGDHFQAVTDAASSATQTVVFQNNDLNNTVGTNLGAGLTLNPGGTATVNFNISNNGTVADPFTGAFSSAITINSSNNSTMSGTINNNVIGSAAVVDSGSFSGDGITVFANNTSDITIAITNNQIRQYSNLAGINVHVRDGASDTINATITGNTISNPGTFASHGIFAQAGSVGGDAGTLCVDIGGAGALANSIAGSGANGATDFRVRQRLSTTVRLPGYAGGNTDTAAVIAFIQGRNTGAETGSATVQAPGGGFVGGAACASAFALYLPGVTNQREFLAQSSQTTKPAGIANVSPAVNETAANTTSNSHKPKLVSSKPSVSKTFSHHAKIAKRSGATEQSSAVHNDVIRNSTVKVPVTNNRVRTQELNLTQEKKPRGGISVKPEIAPLAGETVTHSVGTLLAGKTVHIQFQVTVNSPYLGGASVSNQGTVSGSNFSDVLTDDPAVGGANDPTQTPILLTPNVSVADAQANEPASGSAPMLFTVSLSAPAGASGASVHYQTADQAPGAGHAVAGVDYTAVPDTTLNFAAGEQFKTVSVDILSAGGVEGDETFLLNLSNPTNALIADGQAIGTIKEGNAAGTFLITELRTSGPGGAGDDFVEVYNNSDTPLTVAASDASAGFGLFKMGADCNATPVLIGTIPNGTVIPARGHYLFTGSAYSLANYGGTGAAAGDQTLSADIESDANVGIFNTASVAGLSSVTRLDAVGFGSNTGGNCDLLREGTTLPPLSGSALEHSYVRDECGKKGNPAIFGACPTGGLVKDTNVNNDDFFFVDTSAAVTVAGQRLGAPGPQNLGSPRLRNSTISTLLLDSNFGAPAPPNRVRDLTPVTNGANGTLSLRRRFVNNTGAPVTRLRFRIVDISSISVPGGIADVRALTSTSVVVTGITDASTCLASNGVATTPCTVTVQGTTLEQPPNQTLGGAHNSSMSAGTITLGAPLAPGASINLQFLLGVQQSGSFKFFINVEALP